MFDIGVSTDYTLSMKRGNRYIGVVNGRRCWKALLCGHPVPNYQTKRCKECWLKSDERKNAITKKRNYNYVGELHHSWKGGKTINSGGYVVVRVNKKYVLEHRLVMEKHLNRSLTEQEEVHHINGNKTDNRISNLMLFSSHAEHIAYEHNNGDRKK